MKWQDRCLTYLSVDITIEPTKLNRQDKAALSGPRVKNCAVYRTSTVIAVIYFNLSPQ